MKKLIILLFVLLLSVRVYAINFVSLNSGTTRTLTNVVFTDANTGYAIGSLGTIIKTTNAGNNWFTLSSGTTELLYGICFTDANTGYISGYNGVMLKTTNAGVNWSLTYVGGNVFYDVYFIDNQTGWMTGVFSTCKKTTNAGVNWISQSVPISDGQLFSVVFNNGKGFIGVGGSSNLLTTTNFGTNWVDNKTRIGDIGTKDISFSGNFGVIVGSESVSNYNKPVIFITSNNGQNWSEFMVNNKKAGLNSVSVCKTNSSLCFAAGRYIYDTIYGNKGLIMYSTNSGINWIDQAWNTDPSNFNGVATSPTDVYIVGENGLIIKSALPIGIKPISSEVPDEYILSQNYPNPFNPTTKIDFSILKTGNVKLSVFDMIGREVSLLYNGKLTTGTYQFDFDGSNLSSGTYFYRLEANDFVLTKKMVLLR